MGEVVTFTLDGREVSAPEGELLVHALARHDVFVPTLCHDNKLDPYGGCRMCVVGVEGSPRPLPACATRVTEGMVVSTNSSVPQFQRTLTEMLLSEHLNGSPAGRPNELLQLADDLGVEAPIILPDAKRHPYEDRDLTATVLADADESDAGIASAVNNAVARVAGLLGISVVGLVVASRLTGETFAPDQESVSAFHIALVLCAVLVAAGGVIALLGIVNPRRRVLAEGCAGGQLVGAPEAAA